MKSYSFSAVSKIQRIKNRVRLRLKRSSKLRLSVFKSNCHFCVQLIDDVKGITLAAASTLESSIRSVFNRRVNRASVKEVAKLMSERLTALNLESSFVFDRGAYKYTGVVSEFADELRALGFKF